MKILLIHGFFLEIGLNWTNIYTSSGTENADVTMANVFNMFLFDFVLYMILAAYIDGINPGQYGLTKPWHFPLSVSIDASENYFYVISVVFVNM